MASLGFRSIFRRDRAHDASLLQRREKMVGSTSEEESQKSHEHVCMQLSLPHRFAELSWSWICHAATWILCGTLLADFLVRDVLRSGARVGYAIGTIEWLVVAIVMAGWIVISVLRGQRKRQAVAMYDRLTGVTRAWFEWAEDDPVARKNVAAGSQRRAIVSYPAFVVLLPPITAVPISVLWAAIVVVWLVNIGLSTSTSAVYGVVFTAILFGITGMIFPTSFEVRDRSLTIKTLLRATDKSVIWLTVPLAHAEVVVHSEKDCSILVRWKEDDRTIRQCWLSRVPGDVARSIMAAG